MFSGETETRRAVCPLQPLLRQHKELIAVSIIVWMKSYRAACDVYEYTVSGELMEGGI